MNDNNLKVLPGAGPFYFKGNKIGLLLIHGGGGGTCADLKPLAQDLHKLGNYTISVPLLPGFGTNPEDLHGVAIETWKQALRMEFKALNENCDVIIVGGHSMGGLLALLLAIQFEVNGLFTIGAPTAIRGIGVKLVPFLKLIMKYHKNPSEQFKEETNGKWVGYDKIPLNIVDKFRALVKQVKNSLSEIDKPIIIFQGMKDRQLKKKSASEIYNKVKSIKKKKIWLENSEHPILDCPDHRQIVEEINKFILDIVK